MSNPTLKTTKSGKIDRRQTPTSVASRYLKTKSDIGGVKIAYSALRERKKFKPFPNK